MGEGRRALGIFVTPNVGEARLGETVGAHKAGIRRQTDGLIALSVGGTEGERGSGTGAFVLTDSAIGLGERMPEGVDSGSLAGFGKALLGETVGAQSAGIRMQTVGLKSVTPGGTEGANGSTIGVCVRRFTGRESMFSDGCKVTTAGESEGDSV